MLTYDLCEATEGACLSLHVSLAAFCLYVPASSLHLLECNGKVIVLLTPVGVRAIAWEL